MNPLVSTDSVATLPPSHTLALCRGHGVRRDRLLSVTAVTGLTVLLWTVCAPMPLYASDLNPVAITIVERSGLGYSEPIGRRIMIQRQPMHLFFRIRNTTEAAVMIRDAPEKAYALELKDQAGVTVIVKRKTGPGGARNDEIRVSLAPGADKIIPMQISQDTWDNVPVLEAGMESTYTARVVYETADGRHVYSEFYTLIFNIPGSTR